MGGVLLAKKRSSERTATALTSRIDTVKGRQSWLFKRLEWQLLFPTVEQVAQAEVEHHPDQLRQDNDLWDIEFGAELVFCGGFAAFQRAERASASELPLSLHIATNGEQ